MRLLYRMVFFLVGLTILSFGISLTIKSGLGSGAWDALNVGLSETIAFTPGSWVVIIGVALIFVNSLLLKNRPDFGAIITLFITGLFIDFWLLRVFVHLNVDEFLSMIIVLLSGILLIGLGISIYIQAKLLLSPIDNLMMALSKRFGLKLMVAKTIGEVIALVLALIFSGPIGIGTIIVTLGIGPLIQLFSPHFERLLNKLTIQIS
ncbi:membrane protein [Bacillus sp. B15-48]|uniref:YczE/YyaS/YitT family protein n=1 Tax=Bacillus sp. B15-48 TaxID=1548601 RepID=UPI0019401603|nr:membrane protein [Bacillus sp. B15-48]MBM4764437.1 membrane protein [Bacillus sp. B15-48]